MKDVRKNHMRAIRDMISDTMQVRFACKEYDPQRSIDDEDFQCILEAARFSPSSFGFEPWQFLVVQDTELRKAICGVAWGAQTQLPTCSRFVVVLARQPWDMAPKSDYIQRTIMQETQHLPEEVQKSRTEKYADFLQNDFDYDDNDRAKFEWACRQCYIALGNMFTAAAMLGIDSCPHEGFDKRALEKLLADRGLLNLSEYGAACMVSFGYRKQPPKHEKTRRPMDQVVKWA